MNCFGGATAGPVPNPEGRQFLNVCKQTKKHHLSPRPASHGLKMSTTQVQQPCQCGFYSYILLQRSLNVLNAYWISLETSKSNSCQSQSDWNSTSWSVLSPADKSYLGISCDFYIVLPSPVHLAFVRWRSVEGPLKAWVWNSRYNMVLTWYKRHSHMHRLYW